MIPPLPLLWLRFRYLVKSLLPGRASIFVRQRMARHQLGRAHNVWPILESAGHPPPGWTGWPEGKDFSFVITHDVDTKRGLERCLQLADAEEQLGFRSGFYFVPRGRYQVPESLLKELVRRGFEVGVHGLYHDWRTFTNSRVFKERAPLINHYLKQWGAVGFRAPSMICDLRQIRELAVDYDASTFDTDPFEPYPKGTGTIFPFWIEGDGTRPGFAELPYTLPQDHTLFILLQQRTTALWKTKLAWIASKGGMALMDVHPCYTDPTGTAFTSGSYPLREYTAFLEHVRQTYAGRYWHALPSAMAHYCRDQPRPTPAGRRKHICMMAYAFYDTDNRIIRYAETLARRGDQVDIISLRRPGQPRAECINGVRVLRIQERIRNERFAIEYLWRMLRFFRASSQLLARLHKANPYQLIHVHSVPDFQVFAARPAKHHGARVILDIHDLVPEFYASKFNISARSLLFRLLVWMERRSTAFADHVIVANHIWRQRLTERCLPPDKCLAVLNYIDNVTFSPRKRQRNDDRFIAVYPGGLQWHQGVDIAVRAFGLARKTVPNIELHIYGEGSEKDRIRGLIDQLELNEVVALHPVIPHRDVAQVIANADLGIVPKRADSFGNEAYSTKILEYMSQGIPVLASRTMVDTHYFQEPVVRFFESGNHADMAARITELATDETLRRRMVESAFVYLRENGWDTKQHEYLSLIDSLTTPRSA